MILFSGSKELKHMQMNVNKLIGPPRVENFFLSLYRFFKFNFIQLFQKGFSEILPEMQNKISLKTNTY